MNAKGEKNRDRIDLGLGAILAGGAGEERREVSIDLDVVRQGSTSNAAWTLGGSEPPPKSEFDLLADERKWEEILRRAEPRLSNKSDFDARVWWVRGHLGAFSMPVTFLAAPLESLCRDLQSSEVSDSLRALLKETGLLALARLEEIGEATQAASLRGALEPLGIRQPRGVERKRAGTSSFRSLETPPEVRPPAPNTETHGLRAKIFAKNNRHRLVWTVVCVALVAGILFIDRLFPHMRQTKLEVASDSFMSEPHGVELSRPLPERREPGGRLGALFYSLGQDAAPSQSGAQNVGGARDGTSGPQDLPPQAPAPSAVTERAAPPQAKERVNTEGPIESPDWRRRVERVEPQRGRAPREELRGGPPAAVLPGASERGFESQRTYRVLAKTSVLSAPSYGGRIIGQLERGDRVLVEGKLGRWLRLRSKKGRGGYVIAADVEEVQELRND